MSGDQSSAVVDERARVAEETAEFKELILKGVQKYNRTPEMSDAGLTLKVWSDSAHSQELFEIMISPGKAILYKVEGKTHTATWAGRDVLGKLLYVAMKYGVNVDSSKTLAAA